MQPTSAPTNKDELRGQIRKIVVETSGIDPRALNNQTRIADLGLDGVGVIELTMAVEDTFDFEIPEADVLRLHDLQGIIDYVAARIDL